MSGPRDREIAALFAKGLDTRAISVEVGLSTRSVCRALLREKVREARVIPARPDVDPRMVAMLEDGASYADVAETFDVPVKWLRETVPGYGWDGKTSGMLAHALRKPEVRAMFHEIRRMPLDAAPAKPRTYDRITMQSPR